MPAQGEKRPKTTVFALLAAFVLLFSLVAVFIATRSMRTAPDVTVPSGMDYTLSVEAHADPVLNDVEKLKKLTIDKTNVLDIARTLKRPEAYASETVSTVFADGRSADTKVTASVNGTRTRLSMTVPGQKATRNIIINKSKVYTWEGNTGKSYTVSEKGSFTPDDFAVTPSYEDVFTASSVTDGGIVQASAGTCVYIQTGNPEKGYCDRYWILAETGVLARAESLKNGERTMLYILNKITYEAPEETVFELPSGAVAGEG